MRRPWGCDTSLRTSYAARPFAVRHGRLLNEHGRPLNEHGRPLNEHGRPLNEHGRLLNEPRGTSQRATRDGSVDLDDGTAVGVAVADHTEPALGRIEAGPARRVPELLPGGAAHRVGAELDG